MRNQKDTILKKNYQLNLKNPGITKTYYTENAFELVDCARNKNNTLGYIFFHLNFVPPRLLSLLSLQQCGRYNTIETKSIF